MANLEINPTHLSVNINKVFQPRATNGEGLATK